jgi:O-antigen ligase
MNLTLIKKYLLFAFLIENIIVQTSLLGAFTDYFFYPFLFLGLLFMFGSTVWSRSSLQKFGWMYCLMAIYILYEFVVGLEYISQKTLLYLIAKIATFGIIITGIATNEDFYRGKAIYWLIFVMSFFLLYGMMTGEGVNESSGRMRAGFTNENTTGSMGALIVGMLLFYMRNRKWNLTTILILLVGFFGVLAGGSRAGFLMIFLMIFLRYGINVKTIAFIALLGITGLFILPSIGVHTVGIQRLISTYEGVEGTNRDVEREAAEWMIAQQPWTGWGFEAKNQGYAAMLTELGSHNGYLEMAKQIGIPLAVLFFAVIAFAIVKYWVSALRYHEKMNLFFALVLILIVKANYEGLYVGVHEYVTNLFLFALAMISAKTYSLKKIRHTQS